MAIPVESPGNLLVSPVQRLPRCQSHTIQLTAVLCILGLLNQLKLLAEERRRAQQACTIAERYWRAVRENQWPASGIESSQRRTVPTSVWTHWTRRYCDLQRERYQEAKEQLVRKEEKVVENVLDLVLLRKAEEK